MLVTLDNGLRALLVSDVENIVTLPEKKEKSHIPSESNAESSEDDAMSEDLDGQDEEGESENEDENDPEEKFAACALCIGVGSFSDPPEIQGLAHFLEHMVFMGSEKYPKENALDDFIQKRGGSNNAVTDFEHTTFYIECREAHLEEAMDLFSHFFISPLILKTAMTREREAIDSEFELALPSDGSRFEQLLGSLAPENHPARCFPWGNKVTLEENVEDEVLHKAVRQFWLRHYSAHRMTLAVVGRLSLDTLEKYVRDTFAAIPNNKQPAIDLSAYRNNPWGPEFHRLLWVEPTHDLCEVVLTWVLPTIDAEYEARPLSYLSSIIGHEGKGSLLYGLKKRLLALKSLAGNDGSGFESNSLFSTFAITLHLTEEGLEKLEEVLNIVFCYLAMLKQSVPDQRYYNEIRDIAVPNFHYRDDIEASKYAEELCESMHFYKPEHFICGDDLYLDYRPELLKSIVNTLRHDNVNIAVHCKTKPPVFYDKLEPWFKTKYRMEEIPWVSSWAAARPMPEFHLPPPNFYITRNFDILPAPETQSSYPSKVVDTPLLEVWFRQDTKFKRPIAIFKVYILSTVARSNPLNAALLDTLAAFMQISLEGEFYPAREAGCDWSCSAADFGILLSFAGYNENLFLLYSEVLASIKRLVAELENSEHEKLFEPVKKNMIRSNNNAVLPTSDLNRMVRLNLLLDTFWTPLEKLKCMAEVTPSRLKRFWSELMGSSKAQILVQGNVTAETAVSVGQKLTEELLISNLEKAPQLCVWKMDAGKEVVCRVPSFNSTDNNAMITNYYQHGPSGKSVEIACIADLVMMLMNEPLFDNLRTQQQIGYDLAAEVRDTFGIVGFSVMVAYPCAKFTPDQVNQSIQQFLEQFVNTLRELPASEFQEAKENLIAMKRITDTSLQEEVTRNFAEITSGEYLFNRLALEVKAIALLNQQEVCDWLQTMVDAEKALKKLSIQVVSCNGLNSSPSSHLQIQPIAVREGFISDISEFRKTRQFFPPQKRS